MQRFDLVHSYTKTPHSSIHTEHIMLPSTRLHKVPGQHAVKDVQGVPRFSTISASVGQSLLQSKGPENPFSAMQKPFGQQEIPLAQLSPGWASMHMVGIMEGSWLGIMEGSRLGIMEGNWLGDIEGSWLGIMEGNWLGDMDGSWLGNMEGSWLGDMEGSWLGLMEGSWLGIMEGNWLTEGSWLGLMEGSWLGLMEGS